jgi:hypothetical protein
MSVVVFLAVVVRLDRTTQYSRDVVFKPLEYWIVRLRGR